MDKINDITFFGLSLIGSNVPFERFFERAWCGTQVREGLKFKFKNTSFVYALTTAIKLKKINTLPTPSNLHTFDIEKLFSNIKIDLLYNTLKTPLIYFISKRNLE